MFFCPTYRKNPATGNDEPYYRIKESYRDRPGRVHSLVLLSPGFIKGYSGKALVVIDAGISSEDNLPPMAPILYSDGQR